MSETVFNGFGQFSRPDIGLISDGSQNLSEIFDSDKRDALRNILIPSETLDTIYGLSSTITREDLRSSSGLSRFLLPALNQIERVLDNRIGTTLNVDKVYYSPEYPLGGIGSPTLNQPNVVIFNGSIQCEGVQYRVNTLGSSLFSSPIQRSVSLSTSRASLFNSVADPGNPGYFKSAKYSGTVRVRRRSHVNRIVLPRTTFITKSSVAEAPTHTIRVDIDNGNTGSSVAAKILATKNSPLRVFCRMATGSVRFTFTDTQTNFFGYQVQPVQLRPGVAPVEFLSLPSASQPANTSVYLLNININSTGYQNLYDLYLYLYVNPEKVSKLEFTGINIRETADRRDLGLIGFNNLTELRVSGGSMTILPLWLKTLSEKLVVLDLASSGDTWRSGPMGWFDIRNPSAVPSFSYPLYTAVSYLTIPRKGPMVNQSGNGWANTLFEKYVLNQARVAGTDYRQFSKLERLRLGDLFFGESPRFDDVFPNLIELNWGRTSARKTYRYLFGSLPRVAKSNSLMVYNIQGSLAAGNIYQIGTSTDPNDANYISKYKFSVFNVSGLTNVGANAITGYIGNPAEDWSSWYQFTTSISYAITSVKSNIQSNKWESLVSLSCGTSGGIEFTPISSPMLTPKLGSLNIWGTSSTGQLPSLGASSSENTGNLTSVEFGNCGTISLVTTNGIGYLLPLNFAPSRAGDQNHKMTRFGVEASPLAARFRATDLLNLYSLTGIAIERSSTTGRLFEIPLREFPETETKRITVSLYSSNFYDLSELRINSDNPYFSRDIDSIVAYEQNVPFGGCLLPSFEGNSLSTVRTIDISNSLPSTYSSTWSNPDLRGSCVLPSHPETSLSGLTVVRAVQSALGSPWRESDDVYRLTGSSVFNQNVLVGDFVRSSANGPVLARVLSVSATEVVIDRDISDASLPGTVYFSRGTTDISEWFRSGFASLLSFRMKNCRLSGTFGIRSGFSRIIDSSSVALDLSFNVISGYEGGALTRIFSGLSRRITVDLSSNNLPVSAIQNIISECVEIDSLNKFSNCLVRLGFNKLDSTSKYSNYSQSEIFPSTTRAGTPVITSLTRSETFKVYQTLTTTDENGVQTTTQVQVGTQTVSIPGALVGATYYKTLTSFTQVTTESSLAVQFKSLRGVRVDLGFTYVSPSSTPTVVSVSYSNETTRYQSIIDAGYNPADLVNP